MGSLDDLKSKMQHRTSFHNNSKPPYFHPNEDYLRVAGHDMCRLHLVVSADQPPDAITDTITKGGRSHTYTNTNPLLQHEISLDTPLKSGVINSIRIQNSILFTEAK